MTRPLMNVLIIASLAASALAQTSADRIRQGEARQQQIKTQTLMVADQLGGIIEEFRRNGLDGDDVNVLVAIRTVLTKLSDKEMQRVIDLLQLARSTPDANASTKNLAGAVADQKTIIVQMRQLLLEYQRQQALYDLSLRLAALAERQNGNLKVAVELAKATNGKTGSAFDENQRASLQVQQAEQQALKEEVNPLLEKLQVIARDAEGPTRDRLEKAMQMVKEGGLRPTMDATIEDLKAANLFRAAGGEKSIRDQLRDLSRQVAPPKDNLQTLRQAAAELQKSIDQQRQLREQTRELDKKDHREKPQLASELESRQADLVDRTDQLRKDLENVAPDAANSLKNSTNEMQEARADLNERKGKEAAEDQQQALDKLEEAKRQVEEAIARAEPSELPADRLAALRQLQERTRELIRQEDGIKAETVANERKRDELKKLAPRQDDVEARTRELQKQAVAEAPEAAQSMGDAANQMDKAEKTLTKPDDPRLAQEAAAAAVAALRQADEQIGKRIADLEKAEKDLAELREAREKVARIINDQQQVEMATGKAADRQQSSRNDQNRQNGENAEPSPRQLAGQQEELARKTDQVKNDLQDLEKSAAGPLEDARQDMTQARSDLAQNKPAAARPEQQEALANLFKAKDALDRRIEDLEKRLGEQPMNADAIANALAQVEELQQDTAMNQEVMSGEPQAMQKSLEEQQRDIAEALEQMAGQPNTPQQVDQARQAASQAAERLAQNQLKPAAEAMAQAQRGMQEAMRAQPASQQPTTPSGKPLMPQLSQKQMQLQQAVEQMLQGRQPDPLAEASQGFEASAMEAGEMAAFDQGQLPNSAASAIQQAAQALSQASSAAAAGNQSSAQAAAQQAQEKLAQAAAALALAQAGLSGQLGQQQMASAQQGQQQGQMGQQPGQGQKGDNQGNTPGQGQKGQANENKPTKGTGNREGTQSNVQNGGQRRTETAAGKFIGLPQRDRAAITQSQNDKYPEEYGAQIEQYLKNLADQEEK